MSVQHLLTTPVVTTCGIPYHTIRLDRVLAARPLLQTKANLHATEVSAFDMTS
jgi:hypothetical protein